MEPMRKLRAQGGDIRCTSDAGVMCHRRATSGGCSNFRKKNDADACARESFFDVMPDAALCSVFDPRSLVAWAIVIPDAAHRI